MVISDSEKIAALESQVRYWQTRYHLVIQYGIIEPSPALISELKERHESQDR